MSLNTFHLAWAPLHRILYHEPGNRNFHFLDPITGEQHPLLRDSSSGWVFDPVVSPDGTRAAARWNKSDQGVGLWIIPLGDPSDAIMIASSSSMRRGIVNQSVDASNLRGREVKLLAYVKTNVSGAENHGHCLLRVERPEGLSGFVDEMETRPIRSRSWNQVEIVGKVDTDAERLVIGCFLRGVGDMSVDAVQLLRRNTAGEWTPIALHNPGFEERDLEMRPVAWSTPNGGYVLEIAEASAYQGQRALSIKSAHAFGDFHAIGWSPDGNHVYAFDNTDGRKVVAVRADGGEVKPLIGLSEAVDRFWGGVVTPDGQHIVYSQGQVQTDAWIVDNFDSSQ